MRENEWNDAYGDLGLSPQSQMTQLPLNILVPWQDSDGKQQPFKPYNEEKLQELAESIEKRGVIEAICVRPLPDRRMQILAGHNRVAAAKLAGLTTIPAQVRMLDDNEAKLLMLDSNLQHREKLSIKEKALAYSERLTTLRKMGFKQGKRTDLTSPPLVEKLSGKDALTTSQAGKENGESHEQVRRYIRLTELIEPLLDLADTGKLSVRAGVELSYLTKEYQKLLLQVMQDIGCKAPSMAQATKLRKLAQQRVLNESDIYHVLVKVKKAAPILKIASERISSFFPPNTKPEVMEAEIYEALLAYRQREV